MSPRVLTHACAERKRRGGGHLCSVPAWRRDKRCTQPSSPPKPRLLSPASIFLLAPCRPQSRMLTYKPLWEMYRKPLCEFLSSGRLLLTNGRHRYRGVYFLKLLLGHFSSLFQKRFTLEYAMGIRYSYITWQDCFGRPSCLEWVTCHGKEVRNCTGPLPVKRVLPCGVVQKSSTVCNALSHSEHQSETSNPHIRFPGVSWEFIALSKSHPGRQNKDQFLGLNCLKNKNKKQKQQTNKKPTLFS